MAKHKPRRRPKPEEVPQQPRDRLAEIRAEIRDVPQQIEARRRDAPVIRTPEDLTTWERTIAELTARRAALRLAEVMQAALGDPENRRQARSLAQGLVLIHVKSINVDACLAPGRSPEARQT
jgi:hypothetical protein